MRSFFILLSALFILLSPLAGDDSDGYGWFVPDTPVCLSGYLSAGYDSKEQTDPGFDDIALLLYANRGRYHLLSEAEISDLSVRKPDLGTAPLLLERLQLAYDLDSDDTITIGKFNSDIGFWNLARISILTDTTTAPHILKHIFPELTTGLLYRHRFDDADRALSLTLQHNEAIDNRYNNMRIDRHYAIGYSAYTEYLTWRLNAGQYRKKDHTHAWYAGVGMRIEKEMWRIDSELFHKHSRKGDDTPYDGYLQLVTHITDRVDSVLRGEYYRDDSADVTEGIMLIGLTYRPSGSFTLKAEYLHHTRLPQNRFVFSLSVLF